MKKWNSTRDLSYVIMSIYLYISNKAKVTRT